MRHTVVLGVLATVGILVPATPSAIAADATTEIEAALTAAEATAAGASVRALEAVEAATRTRGEADAAASRAVDLQQRADAAEAELGAAADLAGAVAATRYRDTGGALIARLLTSAEPETLLARLALLERIGVASTRAMDSAQEAAALAASLSAQADLAAGEHERLAAEADAEAARARAEADAEAVTVAAAQAELDALYARLAATRRTSVATEKAARLDQQTATAGSASTQTPGTPTVTPPTTTPVAPVPTAPTTGAIMTPAQAREHARGAIGAYGWGDDQFTCLVSLWNRESGWRVEARNPSSGAYGIPQAYPAERLATAGADWRTSGATQITWGLSYIKTRYGSPCGAWAHSEQIGWY